MARLPDLEGIAIFAKVAERRSFADAAAELRLSKATVSKAISRVEARLGARLIIRTARRFELTDTGRQLVGPAAHILAEAEVAEHVTQAQARSPRGLPQQESARFPALGLNPAHATKAMSKNKMILDRLLEQSESAWTQISCTLEPIDFSAFNRVRLKAGRSSRFLCDCRGGRLPRRPMGRERLVSHAQKARLHAAQPDFPRCLAGPLRDDRDSWLAGLGKRRCADACGACFLGGSIRCQRDLILPVFRPQRFSRGPRRYRSPLGACSFFHRSRIGDRNGALLFVPYLLWISFAAALNRRILQQLNASES